MSSVTKRLNWWWCQDDECDCTQPRIEEVTDLENGGGPGYWQKPRYKVVTLEEGPFISPHHSTEKADRDEQRQWAVDACARHGVEFYEMGSPSL